ncbi:MAG: type I secretion system permease/ATPase [Pseudomonadota bacterium]
MNKSEQPKPDLDEDAERMRRGADRLAEILRDPGPGITVTPIVERLPDGRSVPLEGPVNILPTHANEQPSQAVPPLPGVETYASPQHALKARLDRATAQRHSGPTSTSTPHMPEATRTSAPDQPVAPARQPVQPQPARATAAPQAKPTSPAEDSQWDGPAAPMSSPSSPRTPANQRQRGVEPGGRQNAAPSRQGRLAQLEKRLAQTGTPPPPPSAPSAKPKASQPVTDAAAAKGKQGSELAAALRASREAFIGAAIFSFVINLLMLAGPLFMLQVYDRVMTSGSIPTLIGLSAITIGAYAIIGILELVRSRVIVRVGMEVDARVTTRVFDAALKRSIGGTGHSVPALRELDSLRQFLAGQGPLTFFDAPWTPVYLLVIFLMHWMLGVAAAIGALILLTLAWLSEVRSRQPILEAGRAAGRSLEMAETGQRNAEAIMAMGMTTAFRHRWQVTNQNALSWQMMAADRLGAMTAASKSLRLLMQSMMLAIGAALALQAEISAGVIVAATIIFGRALAPVEQAIGQWRSFLKARESYAKLDELLEKEPAGHQRMELPAPKGHLSVRSLRVAAPQNRQLILANINFDVRPGEMLAIIGPSASGKSSLVRALVGLWPPASGSITLDGSRLDHWDSEDLGQHIGYLPQAVELFAGTVKDNIARFQPGARDEDVVEAAKQAFAHDLIVALPNGYDTELGAFATHLSAGQRQRIALARALFRQPRLIVLDEPNANLDRHGDVALASAIDGCRARGQAVVLVSHRVQAITKSDLIVFIDRGVQRAFGPRDEVMEQIKNGQLDAPIERRGGDRRQNERRDAPRSGKASDRRAGGRRVEDHPADRRPRPPVDPDTDARNLVPPAEPAAPTQMGGSETTKEPRS